MYEYFQKTIENIYMWQVHTILRFVVLEIIKMNKIGKKLKIMKIIDMKICKLFGRKMDEL